MTIDPITREVIQGWLDNATEAQCSAAHSDQWQKLELIFRRLLQHRNMCAKR